MRGGIFLLLCLCQGLLFSFFLLAGGISRHIYPWWELAIILIFVSSFMFGYCIRIFRENANPPSFAPVGPLIKDGVIAQIALWVWWIPSAICITFYAISRVLVFYWISLAWLFVPLLVSPLIFFQYANTGKFVESVRFSKILSTIRTLGGGTYIAACGIWVVSIFVLAALALILNFILVHILPVNIAPPLSAIGGFFAPVLYIFISRFFTNVLGNRDVRDATGTTNVAK